MLSSYLAADDMQCVDLGGRGMIKKLNLAALPTKNSVSLASSCHVPRRYSRSQPRRGGMTPRAERRLSGKSSAPSRSSCGSTENGSERRRWRRHQQMCTLTPDPKSHASRTLRPAQYANPQDVQTLSLATHTKPYPAASRIPMLSCDALRTQREGN